MVYTCKTAWAVFNYMQTENELDVLLVHILLVVKGSRVSDYCGKRELIMESFVVAFYSVYANVLGWLKSL